MHCEAFGVQLSETASPRGPAGVSAFGRGYVPGVLRAFPSKGVELMAYNTMCETFVQPGEQPTVAQSLAFGAVSAVMSQSLTMPLLSLRTKMMGQVG